MCVCDSIGSTCILEAFSYNGIVEDTKAGIKKIDNALRDAKKGRETAWVSVCLVLSSMSPFLQTIRGKYTPLRRFECLVSYYMSSCLHSKKYLS